MNQHDYKTSTTTLTIDVGPNPTSKQEFVVKEVQKSCCSLIT